MKRIALSLHSIMIIVSLFLLSAVAWKAVCINIVTYPAKDNLGSFRHAVQLITETVNNAGSWSEFIPQRQKIAQLDALAVYYETGHIGSSQVMKGKGKWLFYNDAATLTDFEGKEKYSDEEMNQFLSSAQNFAQYLQNKGIQYAVLISPNKENLYHEFMPSQYQYDEESRTDLLTKHLFQNGINIINAKDALAQYKNRYPLYYYFDTHWNQVGAYIGVGEAAKTWGLRIPPIEDRTVNYENPEETAHEYQDDLAGMAAMPFLSKKEVLLTVEGSYTVDWRTFFKHETEVMHYENKDASIHKAVFMIGDSFRAAMLPALCEQFRDVYVIHRNAYQPGMMEEIHPDYVIIGYVERFASEMKNLEKMIEYDEG